MTNAGPVAELIDPEEDPLVAGWRPNGAHSDQGGRLRDVVTPPLSSTHGTGWDALKPRSYIEGLVGA